MYKLEPAPALLQWSQLTILIVILSLGAPKLVKTCYCNLRSTLPVAHCYVRIAGTFIRTSQTYCNCCCEMWDVKCVYVFAVARLLLYTEVWWFSRINKLFSRNCATGRRPLFRDSVMTLVGKIFSIWLFVLRYIYIYIYIYTRVGTLIVATIYLQLIQNRYMFRSFTLLQCSHQHCVQPVASDVEVVGYL